MAYASYVDSGFMPLYTDYGFMLASHTIFLLKQVVYYVIPDYGLFLITSSQENSCSFVHCFLAKS